MADRGVTIRELAEAAGVSIGTVSRALKGQPGLSEQTRAQVLSVAQQLGYDTAKLRTGKPRRMLFLYSRSIGSLANNPFYSYVLHGAETACRDPGVPLSIMSVLGGEDIAGQIRRHEADALLVAGYIDPEAMDAVRQCELPLVLVDHFYPGVRCVNDDNLLGGLAGHAAPAGGQLQAHRRHLRAAGALLHVAARPRASGYREAGRDAMRRLLALPAPPDAVFAYNDSTAMTAIEYCQEQRPARAGGHPLRRL
ncbi:transcriptional regulator, LacI family [Ostertagia ostertagi]